MRRVLPASICCCSVAISVSAVRPSTLPVMRTTVVGARCSTMMSIRPLRVRSVCVSQPLDESQTVAVRVSRLVVRLVHELCDEVPTEATNRPTLEGRIGVSGTDGGRVEVRRVVLYRDHDLA